MFRHAFSEEEGDFGGDGKGESMRNKGLKFITILLLTAILAQSLGNSVFSVSAKEWSDANHLLQDVTGMDESDPSDTAQPEAGEETAESLPREEEETPMADGTEERVETTGEAAEQAAEPTGKLTEEAAEDGFKISETMQAARRKAEEEFATLCREKPVMALVYLTDLCPVYKEADGESKVTAYTPQASTFYLNRVSIGETGVFYYGSLYAADGAVGGYIEETFLAYSDEDWIAWREANAELIAEILPESESAKLNAASYDDVERFPAGYQAGLRALKQKHPNWIFVPMDTGMDFGSAVSAQMGDKSWIWINAENQGKGYVGNATGQGNWAYATKTGVSNFMDPRNFLTEGGIFQFELLTYNTSYHTQAVVANFLSDTFMKGQIPGASQTYASALHQIGRERGISPVHLASRIIQEHGKVGTSPLISGKYSGYEGYYNFFNIGATGKTDAEVIRNGLARAKRESWNTRLKSLTGGAGFIGNGYILKGQDTVYLQKFNVNPNASHAVHTHQYMQNVQAPSTEAASTKKMYADAGSLNSSFVFKIPVYSNLPGMKLNKSSATINVGKTLQLSVSVRGTTVAADRVTWKTSNEAVATVKDGLITAVAPGKAVISATYDGDSAVCNVTVKYPLQSIHFTDENGEALDADTMRRPDTIVADANNAEKETNHDRLQLSVSYFPDNTTDSKAVVYRSDNPKIATVNQNGLIKAVRSGTAKIIATSQANQKIQAVCEVTVIAPITEVALFDPTNVADATELLVGQKRNLSVRYVPADTTDEVKVQWGAQPSDLISIIDGQIKGLAAGSATVTATVTTGFCTFEDHRRVTVKNCTVRFMDAEGGSAIEEKTLGFGDRITAEALLTVTEQLSGQTGAVFVGWYTAPNGAGSRFTEATAINGELLVLYPHYEETGRGFYVEPVGDQVYRGAAIRPILHVYDSVAGEAGRGRVLQAGIDYTVSYANHTGPANENSRKRPTITVKGKGNYTGVQKVYFNILPKDLADSDIVAENVLLPYNGKVRKGKPVVKRDGKVLRAGKDYKLSYPDAEIRCAYLAIGTYPIVITGIGGYTGAVTVYETIRKEVPAKIGIKRIKVTGITNRIYTGNEEDAKQKFGSAAESGGVDVLLGTEELVYSSDGVNGDYTVSYAGIDRAGTATVTITGINAYTGTVKKTYRILPYSLQEDTGARVRICWVDPASGTEKTDLSEICVPYRSKGARPELRIYDTINDTPHLLREGTDYKLKLKYHTQVTKATTAPKKYPLVTITGLQNYQGSLRMNYKVERCDFAEDAIALAVPDVKYRKKANAWKATPTVRDRDGKKLKVGRDYVVTEYVYAEPCEVDLKNGESTTRSAGESVERNDLPRAGCRIRVSVTGRGNYTEDTLSCTYRIARALINSARVKVRSKIYDGGNEVRLTEADLTSVLVGADPLIYGQDYEIDDDSYVNHRNKGRATVVLRACDGGNYGGSLRITYVIAGKTIVWWRNNFP